MGICGLTTYVAERSQEYFEDVTLNDCIVLIDGNAAAAILYGKTGSNYALGGDYDKFAHVVREFVKSLQQCHISPCFVFDGAYEQQKFETVLERIKLNILICGHYNKYRNGKCFPLLMRDAFKEILRELRTCVLQCDYEADLELIRLSKSLRCAIISNDSDFYATDVIYIPFVTLTPPTRIPGTKPRQYCIKGKVFRWQRLADQIGGACYFPLFSALMGNDYVAANSFSQIVNMKGSVSYRVTKAGKWLKAQNGVELALQVMLQTLKEKAKIKLKPLMKKLMDDYADMRSNLLEFLPNEFKIPSSDEISLIETKFLTLDEDSDLEVLSEDDCIFSDGMDGEGNEEENINDDVVRDRKNFPPSWLLHKYHLGLVNPTIMNILNERRMFITAQCEDYSQIPSHEITFPLLSALIEILNISQKVRCYARYMKSTLNVYNILPAEKQLPTVIQVSSASLHMRETALLKAAGLKMDLIALPQALKCFALSLLYWEKNCDSVNWCHIRALVLGFLALGIVDEKLGYVREEKRLKKMESKVKKDENVVKEKIICELGTEGSDQNASLQTEFKAEEECDLNENVDLKKDSMRDIETCINFVSTMDCLMAAKAFLPFHKLSRTLQNNRNIYDIGLVHVLAQFQITVQQMNFLNSVLNFPLQPCLPHKCFSGTFFYNAYRELYDRKVADGYVERTLLTEAPGIRNIYRKILRFLRKFVTKKEGGGEGGKKGGNLKKKSRKRRQQKRKMAEKIKEEREISLESEDEEEYRDYNNKFYSLYKCEV